MLVDHHGRNSHDEAAVAELCIHALDRVTGHAGQPVAIERAITLSVRVEGAGEDADWVVAAIAMARELNALGVHEDVDAGAIEGRAKGIGVQSLAPFVVGLLVAMATVGGVGKGLRINEGVAYDGGISWKRNSGGWRIAVVLGDLGAEWERIGLADLVRVSLTCDGVLGLWIVGGTGGGPEKDAHSRAKQKQKARASNKDFHRLHR